MIWDMLKNWRKGLRRISVFLCIFAHKYRVTDSDRIVIEYTPSTIYGRLDRLICERCGRHKKREVPDASKSKD